MPDKRPLVHDADPATLFIPPPVFTMHSRSLCSSLWRSVALSGAALSVIGCAASSDAASSADAFPLHARTARLLADQRPFVARLSGSTTWVACPPMDVVGCTGYRLPSTTAREASRLLRSSESSEDVTWAAASLDLAAGASPHRLDEITNQLELLSSAHPTNGELRSDLAVAFLTRHALRGDAASLLSALDEIEGAFMADSTVPVVAFNRAVILDQVHLYEGAERAWRRIAVAGPSGAWGAEAAARADALRARRSAHARFDDAESNLLDEVHRDPQGAREHALDRALDRWATAATLGDTAGTSAACRAVAVIGNGLLARSGDSSVTHVSMELLHPTRALVRGVNRFVQGSRAFRGSRYTEASAMLDSAVSTLAAERAFALADWALIPASAVRMFRADYSAANEATALVRRHAATRGDLALTARAAWLRALSDARQGRLSSALDGYRRASSTFARLGERSNEGVMLAQAADVLFRLGRDDRAMDEKLTALEAMDLRRDPTMRAGPVMDMGVQLGELGLHGASRALLREAVLNANSSERLSDRAEALLRTVSAEFAHGSAARAQSLLLETRRAVSVVSDTLSNQRMTMELARTEAAMLTSTAPALAVRRLDEVAAFFRARHIDFSLPTPLARSATLRLQLGDTAGAAMNLGEAVGVLERHDLRAGDAGGARSLAAARREVYNELVSLKLSSYDTIGAFLMSERGRGNRLGRMPELPPSRTVLAYSMLRDGPVMWIVTRRSLAAVRLPVLRTEELLALARRFALLTRDGRADTAWTNASSRLHALLIQPAAAQLRDALEVVIIADGELSRLPFAALRDSSGRMLLERVALIHASALRPDRRAEPGSARVALVGSPSFDPQLFPELAALPGAARELTALRGVYPRAIVIGDTEATKPRFIEAMQSAGTLHFAGHARLVGRASQLSHLVLARRPGGVENNALSAAEIERMHLAHLRLVVLSSCGTAQSASRLDESGNGLATAFLYAGVGAVVSSLWEADDDGTARLMQGLHARLARGESAATALRHAQLEIMSEGARASMKLWSAFRLEI